MSDSDAVDDALGDALRTALMAGSRMGEQLARLREQGLRHEEAASAQRARELQNRLDTERLSVRAQLEVVKRSEWWDNAKPADVGEVWQTATAWKDKDPEIARSAEVIETQVRQRWNVDVHNPQASPAQVREHLERIISLNELASDSTSQAKKAAAAAAVLELEAEALADSRDQLPADEIGMDEAREDSLRDRAASLRGEQAQHETQAATHLDAAHAEARDAKITADRGQEFAPELATQGNASKAGRRRPQGNEQQQEQSISR